MSKIHLTNWDYFSLKLINPFIDISSLVEKQSLVKTFGVRELMHIDDYQIYKKQQEELLELYTKIKIDENDGNFLKKSCYFDCPMCNLYLYFRNQIWENDGLWNKCEKDGIYLQSDKTYEFHWRPEPYIIITTFIHLL